MENWLCNDEKYIKIFIAIQTSTRPPEHLVKFVHFVSYAFKSLFAKIGFKKIDYMLQ